MKPKTSPAHFFVPLAVIGVLLLIVLWQVPTLKEVLVGKTVASTCRDNDHDGYCIRKQGRTAYPDPNNQVDCDDNNPSVHPGAMELCDSIDNNCDGLLNSGADPDGGRGYTLSSIVYDGGGRPFSDSCVSSEKERSDVSAGDYLRETLCYGGTIVQEVIRCDNGCRKGSCVPLSCTPRLTDDFRCRDAEHEERASRQANCSIMWESHSCPYKCNSRSGHCCSVSGAERCSSSGQTRILYSPDCGTILKKCPEGTTCSVERGISQCLKSR